MIELPEKIKRIIGDKAYTVDDVGMSDSTVILFSDMVLKIQSICEESENEHRMMEWLQGHLPVPRVLAYDKERERNYLLMSKVRGEMSCSETYLQNVELLVETLAEGLKLLWNVDITDCPYTCSLEHKLQLAKDEVDNNRVDMENVEPETFGTDGFESPKALWDWLNCHRPEEEPVLSHGDFCLPNVFLQEGRVSGFIDLGKCGVADKWQDIALCYRSLKHNVNGDYGGMKYEGFTDDLLFEKLGIKPNWEKIKYYILMDELF